MSGFRLAGVFREKADVDVDCRLNESVGRNAEQRWIEDLG